MGRERPGWARHGVYPTWWTSAIDLTNLTYYFWSHSSPSLIWAELSAIDLRPGTPVRSLDPRQPAWSAT